MGWFNKPFSYIETWGDPTKGLIKNWEAALKDPVYLVSFIAVISLLIFVVAS